jgi:LCP family protein required for cell wall assembly
MVRAPRRRLLTVTVGAVALALVFIVWAPAALDTALSQVLRRNGVDSADLDRASLGQPMSILVVGSDQRAGLPPEIPRTGAHTGERADVVMLWLVDVPQRSIRVLSLSRHLRVDLGDHGAQMLAGALEYGPQAVIAATRVIAGVPIHHYVELDFAAIHHLAEAAGGITLSIPRDARDQVTHLNLRAGEQQLDGAEVLAYVRSRHYEELRNGQWVADESDDEGRIGRQHQVATALLDRMAGLEEPAMLGQLLVSAAEHVTVDQTMRAGELAELRPIIRGDFTFRADTLPTRLEVPAAEALSPFPPAHLGTTGHRVLSEPDAGVLLGEFVEAAA